MVRALIALLLCAACANSTEAAPAQSGAETAPVCDIDPRLADAAELAIELWSSAAGQPIPLPTRIELADFGDDAKHAGGWAPSLGIIQISSRTRADEMASSIAHELGHSLGLAHAPGSNELMDPDRDTAARLDPCVTAAEVAAAGFEGSGACL